MVNALLYLKVACAITVYTCTVVLIHLQIVFSFWIRLGMYSQSRRLQLDILFSFHVKGAFCHQRNEEQMMLSCPVEIKWPKPEMAPNQAWELIQMLIILQFGLRLLKHQRSNGGLLTHNRLLILTLYYFICISLSVNKRSEMLICAQARISSPLQIIPIMGWWLFIIVWLLGLFLFPNVEPLTMWST